MFSWLCKKVEESKPPKYRLVPDDRGTYTLEKWKSGIGYTWESIQVRDQDHANELISKLERRTIYLVDADTNE